MSNTVVKELKAVLKGEQMAIEAYNRFIVSSEDTALKNEFIQIRRDHEKHIQQLSERILNLGGLPENGTGLLGVFAKTKLDLEMRKADSYRILEKAYYGEDQGIAAVEEIIKGDLDAESMRLVDNMMDTDLGHLQTVSDMLMEYDHYQ